MAKSRLPEIVLRHEKSLLSEWMRLQRELGSNRTDRISDSQLQANSARLLRSLADGLEKSDLSDAYSMLDEISRQRAMQGYTPSETTSFVFSFKRPLFDRIGTELAGDGQLLAEEIWNATELLDKLGMHTFEAFQKSREEVISRQQQEMLELSTPVIQLWEGILGLPLIGTLDSARTQIVMQNLLEAIVEKSANLAVIDITGVPTVDTLVAQHLLKTVAAARLMGADCIISGIRPQIAQTIIHLGVDLSTVMTKASLADAFQLALKKRGLTVSRVNSSS